MLNRILSFLFTANAHYPAITRSQAVIEFRPDGTIVRANQNFLSALEYRQSEIRGKHHKMFVAEAERNSSAYRDFWKRLRDGKDQTAEFKRISKSGKEIWIQATYMPVFNWFGKVRRVVKIASDITDQKVRSIKDAGKIEAIDRTRAVIEFEMDGTIVDANANFLKTLGNYSLDEIKGQHHRMFVEPSEVESPEYARFWEDLRAGEFKAGEFKRIDKHGEAVWIQAIYNPIFDPSGKPLGVVKFADDITQQIAARDEMKLLSLVTNETDNSVIVTDAEGRIEFVNAGFERLSGYPARDAIGKKPGEVLQGKMTKPETVQRIREKLAAQQPFYEEILNYSKSGDPYWISLAINPIRNKKGKVTRFVSIQTEISETKLKSLAFDTRLQAIGSVNAVVEWDTAGHMIQHNSRLSELVDSSQVRTDLSNVLDSASVAEIHSGAVVRHEIRWPKSSGEELWFDAVFAATLDIDGAVDRVIMFGADVSGRHHIVDEAMLALDGVVESSSQITKIVKSLDQIASQTNMLSLNAAVEAAHAGEAGAGFGVVSKEIGALASRSTKEAKDIAVLAVRSQEQVKGLSISLNQLSKAADASESSGTSSPHPEVAHGRAA